MVLLGAFALQQYAALRVEHFQAAAFEAVLAHLGQGLRQQFFNIGFFTSHAGGSDVAETQGLGVGIEAVVAEKLVAVGMGAELRVDAVNRQHGVG